METQKLGKPTDQRTAMLRGLVSDLLWLGKIETTYDRAKAAGRLADKYITIAINAYKDVVSEEKKTVSSKGKEVVSKIVKDGPKKLAARRRLLAALYEKQEARVAKEKKSGYKARTSAIAHPLVEKLFEELAPKYAARAEESGSKGGYTRVLKSGIRRGDNATVAIVELV